jgi:endonuclease/exonuclease/phosphatase family metal-dependent hydrolase
LIRPDLHVDSLECIWLEIKLNNKKKKYLYGTLYILPTSDLQTWRNIEHSIDLPLNCNHNIILTGDFNINQLSSNINDTIGSLMTQFSLHQLITKPAYVTEYNSSLLDFILVSNPLSVLFTHVGAPLHEQVIICL